MVPIHCEGVWRRGAIRRLKAGSLKRRQGSGRPRTARAAKNATKVEDAVGGDRTLSIRGPAINTGLSRTAVRNGPKRKLKKKSLTEDRMQRSRKQNAQRRLGIRKERKAQMKNGRALRPRYVSWTHKKASRVGQVAGGNRNFRLWVDEGVRKRDVSH